MVSIILAEKPDAAQHLANALSDGKPKKIKSSFGVEYWQFKRSGKDHIVVPAVGHLFNLKQVGKGWKYPIFDVDWEPSFKIRKKSEFSEKYYKTIEEIAKQKGPKDFIIACDFDNEGSVIGYNILRFIFNSEKAKRMKFSTLTKPDLIEAYENASTDLDWNNIECGLARHILDFYYGINSSRALTLAIKKYSKRFSILSAGRVQGPLLTMLYKKEKEISTFVPKPYWLVNARIKIGGEELIAEHEKEKFWDKKEADLAVKNSKGDAIVERNEKGKYKQNPPVPFNITSLQTEAYRLFGYSPQQTMNIAQELYSKAYLSYPRTSSEKLPKQIKYEDILKAMAKLKPYANLVNKLLTKGSLIPNEGKKTDPAHEAIHPTIETPELENLTKQQKNIYDLVCRRFMAVFADPATREKQDVTLKIGTEKYEITGRRTLEKGWIEFYGNLAKFDEVTLPEMKIGDKIPVKKIEQISKETAPPARYSQASIIKEMEKRNLGTRATRAAILQTLYDRKYIVDKSIRVTDLGMNVAKVLDKYVPDFVDEKLTRKFEKDLEKIAENKIKKESVLKKAKDAVIKISEEFKKNEDEIGKELGKAIEKTQEESNDLGLCPNCGGTLKKLFSIFTKKSFAGCNNYNKCKECGFSKKACKCKCPICGGEKGKCACSWKEKIWNPVCQTGYPLPSGANITKTDKICDKCKTPIVQVYRKGKRPFRMCLSVDCPTKKDWLDKKKLTNNSDNKSPKSFEEKKNPEKGDAKTKKKAKGTK